MVYATMFLIIGYNIISNWNGDWKTFLFGFIFLSIGVIFGEAIENKTFDRIKELEKGSKNERKNH